MYSKTIHQQLESAYKKYHKKDFIPLDPISLPHQFTLTQDIEIVGFFAAVLAWGQRKTIINKCNELVERMDGAPYDFMLNHSDKDLKNLLGFKHRTFNDSDLLYFVQFFNHHYSNHESLESAFYQKGFEKSETIEPHLNYFKNYFFSLANLSRTKKHISSPQSGAACKRLVMFMRWMVRKGPVDFGLWKNIKTHQLICPCDVHVERIARQMGLITRPKVDWQTAVELTENLKEYDAKDPVKYDFALFGTGVMEKINY